MNPSLLFCPTFLNIFNIKKFKLRPYKKNVVIIMTKWNHTWKNQKSNKLQ